MTRKSGYDLNRSLLCLLIGAVITQQVIFSMDIRELKRDVQGATERRIYAELSDEATERSLTNCAFLGFPHDLIKRITRISRLNGCPKELVASIIAHEHGRTSFEAAIWVINDDIKCNYPDPQDWQIAALCQLLQKKAFKRMLRSDEMGPYLTEVGKSYNPGQPKAWASDVTVLMNQFLVRTSLPERKPRMSRGKQNTRRR